MNRRHVLRALAGLALSSSCAGGGLAAAWSYQGEHGPERWGDLDAASRVCAAGRQQSPVDVSGAIHANLPALSFRWARTADTIVNNGHTIQVNFPSGSTLMVGQETYQLLQLHFHHPSEHKIAGRAFPLEAHFVHQATSGALGVVGVMMTPGRTNRTFHRIVETMPESAGPPRRSYVAYAGSLTTPPCSETVNWMLLTEPVQMADADIAAFAKLYPMNARPVQPLFRRYLLRSR